MKLKVYGWQSFRQASPTQHGQTREIVATTSKAAVARLAGKTSPSALFCLSETGNRQEVETAMADTGVIFWQDLNARPGTPFNRA